MNQRLCVYTCITGDYDNLHEIENPEKNIDYYCFTNNKKIKSKTWKVIQIQNEGLSDHHLSRKIKMLGHPLIAKNYDVSVWMDASVVWRQSITKFVGKYFKSCDFAAFKHSMRNSIHDEAIACLTLRKDTKENILKTLNFLHSENFPDNLGLYEMTVFIKKHNSPVVKNTMEIWFEIVKNYSKRDQLSFMYATWKTGLKVSPINLSVWDNPWFYNLKHTISIHCPDSCHIYFGNPDQSFNFDHYFVCQYDVKDSNYSFSIKIPCDTNQITFYPTDVIGTKYQNLTIKPDPHQITFYGNSTYGGESAFCITHGIIKAQGDFKKGQKLLFSITMNLLTAPAEINKLIEAQWGQNNRLAYENKSLMAENKSLRDSNQKLFSDLQKVLNSKGWRTLDVLRKLNPKNLFKY